LPAAEKTKKLLQLTSYEQMLLGSMKKSGFVFDINSKTWMSPEDYFNMYKARDAVRDINPDAHSPGSPGWWAPKYKLEENKLKKLNIILG
jgi:histidinol phosphatase-like PHP family hydrolase